MTDRYAVVGHPIGHSKSPRIHGLFAAQAGQDMTYSAMLAPQTGFAATAREFFARGGRGMNITVPFKGEAAAFADELDDAARRADAANTLALRDDGRIFGYNTDGAGLVRDLSINLGIELRGKRVLILGAGGAVRGVLSCLCASGVDSLRILNRSIAKADAVVAQQAHAALARLTRVDDEPFDLIINCTSAGLSGEFVAVPEGVCSVHTICYDMIYGSAAAAFARWAANHGAARFIDGLGMLVEQAAEAFFIWRGIRPETRNVITLLREELN